MQIKKSIVSWGFIIWIVWLTAVLHPANAQTAHPKYGPDSVKCVLNLTLYRELYRQKNYKEAVIPWRYVYTNCPRATENIFINGANMYQRFVEDARDSLVRRRLIDTLMQIYDNRIRYYGNEGRHLAAKGSLLMSVDSTRSLEAFEALRRSVDLLKDQSDPQTLLVYCRSAIAGFRKNQLPKEVLINTWDQASTILDHRSAAAKASADTLKIKAIQSSIERNMTARMECQDLINLLTLKLTNAPNDRSLLARVPGILLRRGCSDDTLYLNTLLRWNELEPNVNTAFLIAREYVKRKNTPRALEVLKKVMERLTSDNDRASCHYDLGVVYADAKEYPNARIQALEAIRLKAGWGEPWLLIADCYAASAADCGKDELSGRAVFWCAVDQLVKAREADPRLTARVNGLIAQYSRYFPTKAQLTKQKITVGSKYTVGCWINETTTVRVGVTAASYPATK